MNPRIAAFFTTCLAALPASAATYHVSPGGDDSNPGTLGQPFRMVQKGASVAVAGDTVLLRAGTYRETVTPPVNGTPGAPITFQNYSGENAIVTGNDVLTGWTGMGGGVFRAAMPWNYNYELVSDTTFPSNQVFLDGRMLTLLRWPKETNLDPVANPREGTMDAVTISGSTVTVIDAEFTDNPARWVGAKIWVNLARNGQDGQGQTGTVTAASTGGFTYATNAAQIGGNVPWGIGAGTRYYLFHPTVSAIAATGGAVAALDPGEWWFDAAAQQMYVRTWDGQPPAESAGLPGTVEARRRSWAFALDGRAWLTVRGLRLFAASIRTDNGSANRTNTTAPANNILLDGLDAQYVNHFTDLTANYQMQWIAKSGLILSGSAITLQNSTLRYSAGSGVSLLGQGNKVLNNVLADLNYSVAECGALNTGKTYDTPGQIVQTSLDHEIAYNTIHRTPQQGINFRALKNSGNSPGNILARIHHNIVHDVMLRSFDSAAIDTYGTNHQFLRIDHNRIFNVLGQTNFGIYFDFASGGVVDHNLISDVNRPVNINWTDANANQNIRVFNNTALADPATLAGLSTASNTSPGSEVKNNIFTGAVPTLSGAAVSNNLASSNGLFSSAALADYSLAAGAATAIDQGVSVAPFDDPISGAAPDLGALERGQPPWSAGSSLLAPQPSPGGLAATQLNAKSVRLDWTDRSADETHFIIMRSDDGGSFWDEVGRAAADAVTFTDTQLPGGRYLYAVRGDRSPYSARTAGRGNTAQALFYPGLFDAQSGGINIFGNNEIGGTSPNSWVRFDSLDFGAAGSVTSITANYASFNATGQVQVWLDSPTSGTQIATLMAGTSDAVHRDVSGPVSATAAGVHPVYLKFTAWGTANMKTFQFIGNAPALPPAEPAALTATWNGAAVQLAWTDSANNEAEFRIERSAAYGPFTFFARPAANATSATDTTVLAGVHYRYRLCAVNIVAPSAFTSAAVLTIPGTIGYTMLGGSYSWGNAASWSPAGPPGANDHIQHTAASAATYDLDANRAVKDFTVNSTTAVTLHGKPANSALTVTGALVKSGSGALVVGGWNAVLNVNGAFTLNAGSFGLETWSNGAMNFAAGTSIALNGGTLNLVGDAANRVTSFGTGSITLTGTPTLNVWSFSNDLTRTLAGMGGFIKKGNGTLVLKGAGASYGGGTTITSGTVRIGGSNVIGDSSPILLGGGTLAPAGFSETAGPLSVSAASTLDFTGGGALNFGASTEQAWSGNLSITNFDPTTSTLRFAASSAALSAAQLAAITINGGSAAITAEGYVTTPAAAWRFLHFGIFTPTGNAADDADPDYDGMPNLLERALGSNPNISSTPSLPTRGFSANRLTLTFTRAAATTDLTFRVEAGSLENPWTEIFSAPGVTIADQVTVEDTQTIDSATRRFLRLKITRP